jgi:outer membrane biogenesis lipoprotein LolB
MNSLFHWFEVNASVLAVLVTVGVAVLLICCLECSHCPSRDKDDIFKRHEV